MGKGSTRFSDAMRHTEGGDIDVISSKKLKTCTKRMNLPKKIFDDCYTVNLVSVPKKLHSVLQKQHNEYVSQSSPLNRIHKFKWPLQDCNKMLKVYTDEEQRYSKRATASLEKISKNEEEAIAGLLALVELYPRNNKTNEINLNDEISETSKPDLVKKCVQIDVKKDSKDVTDGKKSRKICSSHVYICQIIMDLQIKEDKKLNSLKEQKTDINAEYITNGNDGINLNEAIAVSKTLFQGQACASRVQPCFGNLLCDPSQWSRPMFPKQQMLMNPFIPGAASYQNWQNGGRKKIPPLSSSYVEASLQDAVISK